MTKRSRLNLTLAMIFTLLLTSWGVARIFNALVFERGASGYIKRAADSNSVDLAIKNLETAVNYAEAHGMTSGYTSLFYTTPAEDVGFWHENLKAFLGELRAIKSGGTPPEKAAVFARLGEILLDRKKEGGRITAPQGISIHPHNVPYAWWGALSFVLTVVFWYRYGKSI